MRSNFISAGFVFLSIALQASAAPLPKSAHNFERSLELDLSELDNRHFDQDDLEARSPGFRQVWQTVKNGANRVVSSPVFQAVGSAVAGAAIDKGVNAVFSGRRRHRRRSLELDLSELDNRHFDGLDDVEARDPGFREVWKTLKNGANQVVQSPVFQAVGSAVAGAAIDKGVNAVFSGRRHGRRSLELELDDLEERDPGFREVWQTVKNGANQVVQSPVFQAVSSAVAGAAIDKGVNAAFSGRRHGRRSLEELDDLAVRDPGFRKVWQKVKEGAGRVVQSPVFQAVGSAVAGAAIDKGVNAVFSGRRHRRRSLELDLSELDSRDFDLDDLEVRDPGLREVWQKVKQGAGQVVNSPVFQAVGSAVAGAAIDKGMTAVFSGRHHGRRSLEVDLSPNSIRHPEIN